MLDRYNHPTRDVGGQYIRWFDSVAAPFFKLTPQQPVQNKLSAIRQAAQTLMERSM